MHLSLIHIFLPPKIAPVQIVVIPIAMHKEGVLEKAREVAAQLCAAGLRVKIDETEQSLSLIHISNPRRRPAS